MEGKQVCVNTVNSLECTTSYVAHRADKKADKALLDNFPQLQTGSAATHLKNGVIQAALQAINHVPDAEKAFFVADLGYVYKQHVRWMKALPEIKPFYAIKCNPDPYVLKLLASLGAGFDCASNGEINTVLGICGVDPSQVIYANPCKALSFIQNAAKSGVNMMTFDNMDELHKVAYAHPLAKLVVRILTDDSKSLCKLGLKFGAPLTAVPALLAKAKELHLDVAGVSFHVGSGSSDSGAFADAIQQARIVFDMGKEAGYSFSLLDVGGGFEDETFETNSTILWQAIEEHFPERGSIKIIAEPGRFYVSKAFHLATNIIARRATPGLSANEETDKLECKSEVQPEMSPRVMYYINDGVYGSFNCILFDHQVVTPRVLSMSGKFEIPSTESVKSTCASVWGPTCDSIDCVCPQTKLPSSLSIGDWLAFENMGAYTLCAASQFNGFEISKVIYTAGEGHAAEEVHKALLRYVTSS